MVDHVFEEKCIVKFLNTYHEDEALRRYFLRMFDCPEDLFWHDKDTNFKIEFSAIEEGTSRLFWLNEFWKYQHLYIISKLFVWHKEWDNNETLYNRLCNFLDSYFNNIKEELTKFPYGDDSLSVSSVLNMCFWADKYYWHKKKIPPYFVLYARERKILNQDFYAKYADLLYSDNQEYTSKESYEELMKYFSATDFVVGKSLCLCSFLAVSFHEETRKQKVEELGCEYVPSVIKWEPSHKYLCVFVLLDYLERKLSNTNGIGPKTQFYMDKLNSEMELEKSILGNKAAERYESIIQTIKREKENCDDTRNENIYDISAYLGGTSFYRGYPPIQGWYNLMKISCKEDFPIKKNVKASWMFDDLNFGDTIDFKLDVKNFFSNHAISLASFSRKYKFRKSLWEKLISLSGKPELLVSVRMDIEFTDTNSCIVSNLEWTFEKIWPSSSSDYVYGQDIGIDVVYHP